LIRIVENAMRDFAFSRLIGLKRKRNLDKEILRRNKPARETALGGSNISTTRLYDPRVGIDLD